MRDTSYLTPQVIYVVEGKEHACVTFAMSPMSMTGLLRWQRDMLLELSGTVDSLDVKPLL